MTINMPDSAFADFPIDAVGYIIEHLDIRSARNFGKTCRGAHDLVGMFMSETVAEQAIPAILTQRDFSLASAPDWCTRNKECVLHALSINLNEYDLANDRFKKDLTVLKTAALFQSLSEKGVSGSVTERLRELGAQQFQQKLVEIQIDPPQISKEFPESALASLFELGFDNDREVIIAALKTSLEVILGDILKQRTELRGDEEVALAGLPKDPSALELLSDELKDNQDVILAAMMSLPPNSHHQNHEDQGIRGHYTDQNVMSDLCIRLGYASERLKNDSVFMIKTFAICLERVFRYWLEQDGLLHRPHPSNLRNRGGMEASRVSMSHSRIIYKNLGDSLKADSNFFLDMMDPIEKLLCRITHDKQHFSHVWHEVCLMLFVEDFFPIWGPDNEFSLAMMERTYRPLLSYNNDEQNNEPGKRMSISEIADHILQTFSRRIQSHLIFRGHPAQRPWEGNVEFMKDSLIERLSRLNVSS